ncbi:membrane protein YqaA, SNARE-associated domain [Apibacter mensalis]|uniref:Membrane protein YqaA, SNARE-associated domain n=1 Tax=Apibacter mensalis TaxID=1586267 RepID=A0A0X3ALN2_9FLAO|nr:YqaA family protein [Apibacter mensalis]CVK15246.1 membrane protein YqaA, SNARE-associated domain [Apibacter mensalis]
MLDGLVEYGYIGLFIASYLAATILPFSSEAVLMGIFIMGGNPWISIVIATIGNWLGGMTSYFLGRLGKIEWIEKYLKISKNKIDQVSQKLNKKGAYFSFFSFLPIIGDIIPIALGYMRANMYIVSISMLVGKLFRYLLVMYAFKGFSNFIK